MIPSRLPMNQKIKVVFAVFLVQRKMRKRKGRRHSKSKLRSSVVEKKTIMKRKKKKMKRRKRKRKEWND